MTSSDNPDYLDEIADAVLKKAGPYSPVKTGNVVDIQDSSAGRVVTITYDGCDPVPAQWGSAFDVAMSTKGVNTVKGMKISLLLPDGQPVISDIII